MCNGVLTQCSLCRRDKLWISMEYCGGGSLQDIYHGKDNTHTHTHNLIINRAVFCLYPYSVIFISLCVCLSLPCFSLPVTGPLSESQIAYMSRETLQVTYTVYLLSVNIFEKGRWNKSRCIFGKSVFCLAASVSLSVKRRQQRHQSH